MDKTNFPMSEHIQKTDKLATVMSQSQVQETFPKEASMKEMPKELSYEEQEQNYMETKRNEACVPSMKEAALNTRWLFSAPTFFVHMCFDCRRRSREIAAQAISGTLLQHIVIVLCNVCANAHKKLHFTKYYNFDVFNFNTKRKLNSNYAVEGEPASKKITISQPK